MVTPPEDALCIEDGCTLDAVTTRPLTQTWLVKDGAIVEGVEWVCSIHGNRREDRRAPRSTLNRLS